MKSSLLVLMFWISFTSAQAGERVGSAWIPVTDSFAGPGEPQRVVNSQVALWMRITKNGNVWCYFSADGWTLARRSDAESFECSVSHQGMGPAGEHWEKIVARGKIDDDVALIDWYESRSGHRPRSGGGNSLHVLTIRNDRVPVKLRLK